MIFDFLFFLLLFYIRPTKSILLYKIENHFQFMLFLVEIGSILMSNGFIYIRPTKSILLYKIENEFQFQL